MNDLDVFGVEKTVLAETTRQGGSGAVSNPLTFAQCSHVNCTLTCLCAAQTE